MAISTQGVQRTDNWSIEVSLEAIRCRGPLLRRAENFRRDQRGPREIKTSLKDFFMTDFRGVSPAIDTCPRGPDRKRVTFLYSGTFKSKLTVEILIKLYALSSSTPGPS